MINEFAFQARRGRAAWVQIPPSPLTSCVAVGKSLHVMGPQFSHSKKKKKQQNSCTGIQRDYANNLISILPDIGFKETVTIIVIIIMASSPPWPGPETSQSTPLHLQRSRLGHLLQAASLACLSLLEPPLWSRRLRPMHLITCCPGRTLVFQS